MGLCLIGNLIADTGRQDKGTTVFQFRVQFAFQTQEDMPLLAPMVGEIIGAVGHHSNADIPKILGPPGGVSGFPRMSGFRNISPGRNAKRNVRKLHSALCSALRGENDAIHFLRLEHLAGSKGAALIKASHAGAMKLSGRVHHHNRPFAQITQTGDRLLCVEAVNAPAEFMGGRLLIAKATPVDAEKLADPSVSMKAVAKSG